MFRAVDAGQNGYFGFFMVMSMIMYCTHKVVYKVDKGSKLIDILYTSVYIVNFINDTYKQLCFHFVFLT